MVGSNRQRLNELSLMTPPTERLELQGSLPRSQIWLLLRPAQLTQHCNLNTCLKSNRPKKLQTRPRSRGSKLPWTCSSSMQNSCQSMQIMHGTRLSTTTSKPYLTPIQTSKAVPRKDPGDFCTSQLMNARCSSFSLCSPLMQLSRSGSTSQTCSRSPPTCQHLSVCTAYGAT